MIDRLRARWRGADTDDADCACEVTQDDGAVVIDATDCPGEGDLLDEPACRATAVGAMAGTPDADLLVERDGLTIRYSATASRTFAATGAFAVRVGGLDPDLAARARSDPIGAALDASGRVGPVSEMAVETGFDAVADRTGLDGLRRYVGPSIAAARIDPDPPTDGTLREQSVLDSGATARVYEDATGDPVYHLEPLEYAFDDGTFATLAEAWRRLADTPAGSQAPYEVAADAAGPDQPTTALGRVLAKHARGYGVLDDFFADPSVSEVAVNAPADETPVQVRRDGRTMRTNVRLTDRGAALLAARVRRTSGRGFSRADPTVDAMLTDVGSTHAVRVAGVRPPASEGVAFALRAEATDEWRLRTLVSLGTLTPEAAGLLSVAVERGAAILVAGPRGGGKTTLASALLWELPSTERLLAIEDTPELPIDAIQADGRDAQRLHASPDHDAEPDPEDALRTALRLGDGALVVGEVRGPEAAVLYEAMRVGAASSAVLGTIHGEGAAGVRERVVADLGVPDSSFRSTDLVVTTVPDGTDRRVASVEEVTDAGASALFERTGDGLAGTGRLDRGNSALLATLAGPGETYADVRTLVRDRSARYEGRPPPASSKPSAGTAGVPH